jgi:signal transduction histidine kinase/CheY-like chemotaxis protein
MKYFICAILLFFASVNKANAQEPEYKIMFSNHYPPYNYLNNDGELVGFSIDIFNSIKNLYDLDVSIKGAHWNEINTALENGEINAIGGAHYPGNHHPNFIYTRSTISTAHCFFYNKNFISNLSLEKIRSYKEPLIAMWKNDVLSHYILSINPSAKFIYINSYDDLMSTLKRKDITCAFGQKIGGSYYAKKLGISNIDVVDTRILERNMGFKVSKENPELAKIIDNGLEIILANGEYQRIYDKWISVYDIKENSWDKYLKYILISSVLIVLIILLLIVANQILQIKVRERTKNLRQQLKLNSEIMNELEEQKMKAEESDKMKSAFLANMSHEIRTPMNGILGFTELLKSTDYSAEKQSMFIDIIQQSGNRMLETINNIIDVSKLESGLEKTTIKEVDIKKIVNQLFNFFNPESSSKKIKLKLIENINNSIKFYSDEYKLNSILTNLIKNALKFTNKGQIEIKYSVNNDFAEFWIKDTGIGIPKDKQKAIFDEFVQADYSYSSGFEGSGLGLSISKGYVKLLNGEINLESEANIGTTFYVKIPNLIKDSSAETTKKQQKISQNKSVKAYKFIVADDDETSSFYLNELLKPISERIVFVKNGAKAVESAKMYPDTDVILMDIKMPKLNGLDATKEIRKFNSAVYIIAQTAYAQENYKAEALNVGCNAFISKPINTQDLMEILNSI